MGKGKRLRGERREHRRAREEISLLLEEQIRALEASSAAFDQGEKWEAKRLATTVRVLFHDTRASHSLLDQLGIKPGLRMSDSATPLVPGNLIPEPGLVIMRITAGAGVSDAAYVAPLADRPPPTLGRTKTVDSWWSDPVTRFPDGSALARRDYALTLANKEGGAHVDAEVDEQWHALARQNSLGFQHGTDDEAPRDIANDPTLEAMRQIAWEVLDSLDRAGYR